MKKLRNTEVELKKALLIKKRGFDLQIESVSLDRIFDLHIEFESRDQLIDLKIELVSPDRIFKL